MLTFDFMSYLSPSLTLADAPTWMKERRTEHRIFWNRGNPKRYPYKIAYGQPGKTLEVLSFYSFSKRIWSVSKTEHRGVPGKLVCPQSGASQVRIQCLVVSRMQWFVRTGLCCKQTSPILFDCSAHPRGQQREDNPREAFKKL